MVQNIYMKNILSHNLISAKDEDYFIKSNIYNYAMMDEDYIDTKNEYNRYH
jgi:hypothetical protein